MVIINCYIGGIAGCWLLRLVFNTFKGLNVNDGFLFAVPGVSEFASTVCWTLYIKLI